ncbi:hypothetical protein O181_017694 [Austropuccinia psidii MF-1]|uniref:Uncharacterized protein n=1 Tax=Austropuccinia psidii MF-1 TaxID=1389203 RepID=A0A9Q3C676_9BASI|nr:hypothetical protein [Austropuccinia psidii MF-1]
MQEPYRAANRSSHLHHNNSNFAKWVVGLDRVLCVSLNSEFLVDDLPSSLDNRSLQENRAISHFINAMLTPNFALCIGIVPAHTTAKEFFDAIKSRCCPGNCFQKLKVAREMLELLVENSSGQPKPNSAIILLLYKSFAIFKKLGIDADELEGLLAQAVCHSPASLDQLVTSAILAKGDEKPLLMTTHRFLHVFVPPTLLNLWCQQAMYAVPLSTLWTSSVAHAFTVDITETGEPTARTQRASQIQIRNLSHLGWVLQTAIPKPFPVHTTTGSRFCR